MNIKNCILILATIALTTSCGEYWEGGDPTAREMRLSRRVINLMVGDRYRIPVEFTPEDVSNNAVWWQMGDLEVAEIDNDTIVGVSEGVTMAYATSVSDLLRDSCLVNVIPGVYLNAKQYPYDMVIYADVNIHGHQYTQADEDSLIIAAYKDYELRGIGKMRQWQGKPYMEIRVWSPFEYGDWIDLMCIYRGKALIELFPTQIQFDGETHGTLSHLLPLVIDENAEEYNFGYSFGNNDSGEEEEIVGEEE